jgi:Bifunctional DNA primase/polymerase, N-terminal/Primase C terminal 1 (PriCT-1)
MSEQLGLLPRAALALAKKGLCVFPCRPQDKKPATTDGLKSATTDAGVIRGWWQQEPRLNVAIATGKVSNIFVVDVDSMDAEIGLHRLEAKLGRLPPTVETITARGRHLYFQYPEMPVRNSVGRVADGVDTRGDGGYVLAPPSIHPSGKTYHWSVDSHNAVAAAPGWLLERIAEPTTGNGLPTTPVSDWHTLVESVIPEGRRDCALAKMTGYLLRRYVDAIVVLKLMQSWNTTHCVPPLPEQDVHRIVNSICGKELKRRGIYA